MRRHNLSVICQVLAERGPLSRTALARATGITRGSLTSLSAELLAAGVVRELDDVPSGRSGGGAGRPSTPLALDGGGVALLVAQLDADAVTVQASTLDGREVWRSRARHDPAHVGPEDVLDVLAERLRDGMRRCAEAGRRVVNITLVVFAPVGPEPGMVPADTDLGWGPVDIIGGLRDRMGDDAACAMSLISDAPAALRAELGALRPEEGQDDVLYLKSNSGIGGAAICDGHPLVGARRFAGAFGHIAIDPDGPLCGCGRRGCFVTVAGPEVVLARAGMTGVVERIGFGGALTDFVARVGAGDERASAAWAEALVWIVRALDILNASFNPSVVILGGYWADLAASIETACTAALPPESPAAKLGTPAFRAGVLGDEAALTGARLHGRDRVLADVSALLDARRHA